MLFWSTFFITNSGSLGRSRTVLNVIDMNQQIADTGLDSSLIRTQIAPPHFNSPLSTSSTDINSIKIYITA